MILSVVALTGFALWSEAELQPTQTHLLPSLMTGRAVFCVPRGASESGAVC